MKEENVTPVFETLILLTILGNLWIFSAVMIHLSDYYLRIIWEFLFIVTTLLFLSNLIIWTLVKHYGMSRLRLFVRISTYIAIILVIIASAATLAFVLVIIFIVSILFMLISLKLEHASLSPRE